MYMVKCTIAVTGTAQRVIPFPPLFDSGNTCFQSMIPQNNGSNNMTLGDSSVAPGNGLVLVPAASLGSAQAFSSNPGDLKDFYVIGTVADVLNIMVFP